MIGAMGCCSNFLLLLFSKEDARKTELGGNLRPITGLGGEDMEHEYFVDCFTVGLAYISNVQSPA